MSSRAGTSTSAAQMPLRAGSRMVRALPRSARTSRTTSRRPGMRIRPFDPHCWLAPMSAAALPRSARSRSARRSRRPSTPARDVGRMSLMVPSSSSTALLSRPPARASATRGQALQAEAHGEQALDHQVVQVPPDPVAVLQQGPAAAGPRGPGDLDGQRGLLGEARRQGGVHSVEADVLGRPGQGEHALDATARPQRDDDRRPELGHPASRTGPWPGVRGQVEDRHRPPGPHHLRGQRVLHRDLPHRRQRRRRRPRPPAAQGLASAPATTHAMSARTTSRARSATVWRASSALVHQRGDLRGGPEPELAPGGLL